MNKTTLSCTLLLLASCAPEPATKHVAPIPVTSSATVPAESFNKGTAPMDAIHGNALTTPAREPISGTVQETLESGGFTYVRFSTPKGERWAAIGRIDLPRGATITIAPTTVADHFASDRLKRTFDNLIFGTLTDASSSGKVVEATQAPTLADVPKAEGEHARTIAEIWAGQAAIRGGEPVVVRGRVTKVLSGIMDRNWIHLRDGSGDKDEITVTSQDTPGVGAIVTATGSLHSNRDFGSGYSYAVLIEDARIH